MKNQDIAVKKILQECSEQCGKGIICIPYFKRLQEPLSKEEVNDVFTSIIQECLSSIIKKVRTSPWLLYELDKQFASQPMAVELAKSLTISLIDSASKNDMEVTFTMIKKAIPKWILKNDRDLALGSIIHFLYYFDHNISL